MKIQTLIVFVLTVKMQNCVVCPKKKHHLVQRQRVKINEYNKSLSSHGNWRKCAESSFPLCSGFSNCLEGHHSLSICLQ